jgi:hypothetical protein
MAANTSGLRAYFLRRVAQGTITTAQLDAMADTAMAASLAGKATVDIVNHSSDGASAGGMITVSTADLLTVLTDVLQSIDPQEPAQARQMFIPCDFTLTSGSL